MYRGFHGTLYLGPYDARRHQPLEGFCSRLCSRPQKCVCFSKRSKSLELFLEFLRNKYTYSKNKMYVYKYSNKYMHSYLKMVCNCSNHIVRIFQFILKKLLRLLLRLQVENSHFLLPPHHRKFPSTEDTSSVGFPPTLPHKSFKDTPLSPILPPHRKFSPPKIASTIC